VGRWRFWDGKCLRGEGYKRGLRYILVHGRRIGFRYFGKVRLKINQGGWDCIIYLFLGWLKGYLDSDKRYGQG
jgi:hypothetical protein